MKYLLIIWACLCTLFNLQAAEYSVVPKPLSVKETGKPAFVFTPRTVVYVTPASRQIGELWIQSVSRSFPFQLQLKEVSSVKGKNGIVFDLSKKNRSSEAYTLDVSDKRIVVRSEGLAGLFYGAQTLTQLMPPEVVGKEKLEGDITVPSLQINDKPRFQWRGYMKDVSRTFYSVDVLKKYIDIMSLYKMNTLHLHLTDDQGWRVEIKKYPRLTSEKATHYPVQFGQPEGRSGFYTQEELKDLVAYAAARHVQIVPEIDVPGHCWPVLINYPELAVNDSFYPDYVMPFCETYHVWGHQFTPNTLDPSNEKVYQFLDDVFTEIAAIFPSEYIHFGGDEVRHILWEKNEHIQNFMKEKGMKNVMELQSYFVTRVSAIIAGKGKKPIGWNDILADAGNLPENAHIMSWLGSSAVKDAAKYGFPTIATPASHLYFDIRQGTPDTTLRGRLLRRLLRGRFIAGLRGRAVPQRHLAGNLLLRPRGTLGGSRSGRTDSPRFDGAVLEGVADNIGGNLTALGALKRLDHILNGLGIKVRQIEVHVVQDIVHLNMHLHGCSDHSAEQLRDIGRVRSTTERHHGFSARAIPAGGEILLEENHLDVLLVRNTGRLQISDRDTIDLDGAGCLAKGMYDLSVLKAEACPLLNLPEAVI